MRKRGCCHVEYGLTLSGPWSKIIIVHQTDLAATTSQIS